MRPRARPILLMGAMAALMLLPMASSLAQSDDRATLRVMTFNVWHGLRSGESHKKFPGEDSERAEKRFNWQIEEIRRLDPDVLLFQEVNPNQPQAKRYAEALGYDEIHKVASCGLHLGALYKIPKNVNEGIAILAKPELGLRRVGKTRLSGNAKCSATWGFQTKESRYALFGEIEVGANKVLVATTHLASPSFTPPGFDERLDELVTEGELTREQRDEILEAKDRKLERNTVEAERLVREIANRRASLAHGTEPPAVIFGGDFNAEPEKPSVATVRNAGYTELATGPDFLTWNPVINEQNYTIGTKRSYPLPTFDNAEIEAMLDQRHDTPRQIDHLFASAGVEVVSAEMVMTEAREGIYPSDHFAILATVRLP